MKLILSSYDFRNPKSAKFIYDHLDMPIDVCKVLFIPNEKATEKLIESGMYESRLTEFGFQRENIYVFNAQTPDLYCNLDIDAIYISGGNTFGTMKKLRDTKFDQVIIDYVKNGVIYIGGSAGAHIASADISHVKKYDIDTFGLTDFSGLGLYFGIFVCHYNSDRAEDYKYFSKTSIFPISALTNEDSILVNKN